MLEGIDMLFFLTCDLLEREYCTFASICYAGLSPTHVSSMTAVSVLQLITRTKQLSIDGWRWHICFSEVHPKTDKNQHQQSLTDASPSLIILDTIIDPLRFHVGPWLLRETCQCNPDTLRNRFLAMSPGPITNRFRIHKGGNDSFPWILAFPQEHPEASDSYMYRCMWGRYMPFSGAREEGPRWKGILAISCGHWNYAGASLRMTSVSYPMIYIATITGTEFSDHDHGQRWSVAQKKMNYINLY